MSVGDQSTKATTRGVNPKISVDSMTSKTDEGKRLLDDLHELSCAWPHVNQSAIQRLRDFVKSKSTARQDTERLATYDGIPVSEVITGLADLRVHFRKKGMPLSEKVIDCAIELLSARCGLDEGEQKKDLGVTEPDVNAGHKLTTEGS